MNNARENNSEASKRLTNSPIVVFNNVSLLEDILKYCNKKIFSTISGSMQHIK